MMRTSGSDTGNTNRDSYFLIKSSGSGAICQHLLLSSPDSPEQLENSTGMNGSYKAGGLPVATAAHSSSMVIMVTKHPRLPQFN